MANTIKIKNSGNTGNVPASLDFGELAINYTDGKLFYKNNTGSITSFTLSSGTGAKLTTSDTPPSGPSAGDLWYESDTGKTFIYYDSYWVEIGHGSGAVVSDDITGNAGTATKLQTSRTISLTGDVSGSASFDGSANASITATIQPNSVALGTDTTGNYMSDISASTGITISHTPSEGSTATISLSGGPAFSAYPSSGQTVGSGSQVKILFGTEEFDTANCFSSSRFTPTVAGYYQINSTVRFDGGGPGTGECMIVVWKNGSEAKRGWNSSGTSFANDFFSMSVSALIYCNGSTDYIEIYAQQGSGSNRTTTAYGNISYFQGYLARYA